MKYIYEHLKHKIGNVENTAKLIAEHVQEVEGVHQSRVLSKGVITGKSISVSQHPNADRLKIVQVDIGKSIVTIVTGAPNIAEGQIVAVAGPGSQVLEIDHSSETPIVSENLVTIKTATLRGVESNGMLCGPDELGLNGAVTSGLYIFTDDTPVGVPIESVISPCAIIETDDKGTAHRPDLLSYQGLEQELAALDGKKFERVLPKIPKLPNLNFKSEVINAKQTPVFCVAKIDGLTNLESPEWLRKFLVDNDIKVINLPTDVTNYVMLTEGASSHAFDADKLIGNYICSRQAHSGEIISTLNHQTHKLTSDDIVLADSENALDIAGIIGGSATGVDSDTTSVVLPACLYNPVTIRKTSRRLGIRTEASARFERGSNPTIVLNGFLIATDMITKLGKGKLTYLQTDGDLDYCNPAILISTERINAYLGLSLTTNKIDKILRLLNYHIDGSKVSAPWWRNDINCFADVAEDVARHVGYSAVAATLPHLTNTQILANNHGFVTIIRNILASQLYEVDLQTMVEGGDTNAVTVANPIGREKYMRQSLEPELSNLVTQYTRQGFDDFSAFEIGNVFHKSGGGLPAETLMLGVSIVDNKSEANSLMAKVLHRMHLDLSDVQLVPTKKTSTYTNSVDVIYKGKKLGEFGSLTRNKEIAYGFSINLDELYKIANLRPKYQPYLKLPIVKRDIAMLIDSTHSLGDVVNEIRSQSKIITSVALFDQYSGNNISNGKQSLAFHIIITPDEKTLTDTEINQIMKDIERALSNKFKATIR